MVPRIAVSQAPYLRDVTQSLQRAVEQMRQAASHGADIVVFPEWFLGLNPVDVLPNRWTQRLSQSARELSIMVITGSLRALDASTGKKQQRGLVVDRNGSIAGDQAKVHFQPTEQPWFEPGIATSCIPTSWGRVVILLGLDGSDPERWEECVACNPDLVVMAHYADSPSRRTELQELAVSRSQLTDATVIFAPMMGRFSGVSYLPGALIAEHGRILSLSDGEGLLMAGDPEAPLIQLGATDIAAYPALADAPAKSLTDPKTAIGSEAERRVLIDWGALLTPDPLSSGQHLLAKAGENTRMAALAPARPGFVHELEMLLKDGAVGAFAYPGLDRLPPWSEEMLRLGEALVRRRRPLLVHTGPGRAPMRFDYPLGWDEFLQTYPSLPVILIHMGGRSPLVEEALLLAERHRNVYLETSGASLPAIQQAIQEIGPGRVLFGSGGIPDQFHLEWQKIMELESLVTVDAFQGVVNRNARRLFFRGPEAVTRLPHSREGLSVVRSPG